MWTLSVFLSYTCACIISSFRSQENFCRVWTWMTPTLTFPNLGSPGTTHQMESIVKGSLHCSSIKELKNKIPHSVFRRFSFYVNWKEPIFLGLWKLVLLSFRRRANYQSFFFPVWVSKEATWVHPLGHPMT